MFKQLAPLLRHRCQASASLSFGIEGRPAHQFSDTFIVKINSASDPITERIELAGTPFHDCEARAIGHQQIVLLFTDYLHCVPPLSDRTGATPGLVVPSQKVLPRSSPSPT